MNEFLDQMIRTDAEGHPIALAAREGLDPIYFNDENRPSPDPYFDEIIDMSRQMWTYLGYTGLMMPWHEEDPYKFLKIRRDNLRKFFYRMYEMDIHWKSYCVLSFLMTSYEFWERPILLLNQLVHWGWMEKFRGHAGSRERVDDVAFFMLEFVQLQVRHRRRAAFSKGVFVEPDVRAPARKGRKTGKYLGLYHRVSDRIGSLEKQGVDYVDWLREKFATCVELNPNSDVSINAVVNVNSLDPDPEELKRMRQDPWRYVKEFLGLPYSCQFPDNCLPKGWRPSTEDPMDASRIAVVRRDGYYQYEDGTQRRGKRHYANNKYFCIMCTPENFVEFKTRWDDVRLLTGSPSWEEYSQWGLYPAIWDEKGVNVSNYPGIRDVRWRKKT